MGQLWNTVSRICWEKYGSAWQAVLASEDIANRQVLTTDGTGSADEPDDRIPAWSVEIKYKNGKEQTTKGYDYLPDPVIELFGEFDFYFIEEDVPDGEFDEDDNVDDIDV